MKPSKTKEQIINAYENRFVLTLISAMVQIAGIALTVILADDSNHTASSVALFASLLIALVLIGFAIRCPICNNLKSPEYFETGVFRVKTGFFRCDKCNLTNKQIGEYVDLLKRGIDIDKNTIARFNKRDL